MCKVIKIITLNTFQMVTVRIYDPPYCTLKVARLDFLGFLGLIPPKFEH